jgi:hypothetical protein
MEEHLPVQLRATDNQIAIAVSLCRAADISGEQAVSERMNDPEIDKIEQAHQALHEMIGQAKRLAKEAEKLIKSTRSHVITVSGR